MPCSVYDNGFLLGWKFRLSRQENDRSLCLVRSQDSESSSCSYRVTFPYGENVDRLLFSRKRIDETEEISI